MPQPFRRKPGQEMKMSPAAVVQRPPLGIGIALVASHWAKVEQMLSLSFTALLSGQEPAAFAAYHELFDLSLRHKMFLAAARKKKLPRELIAEAEKLHQDARRVAKSRNAVVHGTWSIIDDVPDAVFLCDPNASDKRVDEFFSEFHDKIEDQVRGAAVTPSWSFDLSVDEYTEYKVSDFQDIINRCITLDQRATELWTKVASFAISAELTRRAQRRRR